MSIYLNGWTRETVLQQIEERNGWERCLDTSTLDCAYKNQQGKTCAVGAFIPNELYDVGMEGKKLEDLGAELKFPLSEKRMRFLQNMHDIGSLWTKSMVERALDRWEDEE